MKHLVIAATALLVSCGVSRELEKIEPINLTAGTIGGSVTDSLNYQPIIGAEVILLTANGDSAVRDQQSKTFSFAPRGEFRFDEVRPGSYVVRVTAAGYRTTTHRINSIKAGDRFSLSLKLRRNN